MTISELKGLHRYDLAADEITKNPISDEEFHNFFQSCNAAAREIMKFHLHKLDNRTYDSILFELAGKDWCCNPWDH